MKVAIIADAHTFKTPDGKYWCRGITDNAYFQRYANVFEEVLVISRVKEIDKVTEKYARVDGGRISVYDMPFARGMKEYIKNYSQLKKAIKPAFAGCDCAILRMPSVLSFMVLQEFKKTKKPFSIEIAACPKTAYKDNFIAKTMYTSKLKKICKYANGVSYVTEKYLQKTYPCTAIINGEDNKHFTSHYSSTDLPPEFFGEKKNFVDKKTPFIISHTSNSTASTMKGQDVLIRALGKVVSDGYDAKILFVGDSEIKDYYMKIATENNVADRITFTGMISSKMEMREKLISSDMFVLPTKAEGLPRCVIEAMALGLPCISTPVNGVPELIKSEYLVEQSDYLGFANLIEKLIENPLEMEKLSEENILRADDYTSEKLSKRRTEFYQKLYNLAK